MLPVDIPQRNCALKTKRAHIQVSTQGRVKPEQIFCNILRYIESGTNRVTNNGQGTITKFIRCSRPIQIPTVNQLAGVLKPDEISYMGIGNALNETMQMPGTITMSFRYKAIFYTALILLTIVTNPLSKSLIERREIVPIILSLSIVKVQKKGHSLQRAIC